MSHWTIITAALITFFSLEAVTQDFVPEDQDAGTDDQSAERYRVELKKQQSVEGLPRRENPHRRKR